jgi:hypothetical protein
LTCGNPSSWSSYAPNSDIEVRSQWIWAVSIPNSVIACAPTEPVISSRCGAIASSARAIRSSLSSSGSTPNTSGTAHLRAQFSTPTIEVGEDSRLATSTSMTCPCVKCATSRTGHSSSMIPATSSRRRNSAEAGRAPRRLSTTEVNSTVIRGRWTRERRVRDIGTSHSTSRTRPGSGHIVRSSEPVMCGGWA